MSRFQISNVLDSGVVYSLWQAPFADLKMQPVLKHNRLSEWKSVLDVACGPGTNARYFRHSNYLGFDLNSNYIQLAKQRFGDQFVVGDALTFHPPNPHSRFEHILANSFFHHLSDADTRQTLQGLSRLMAPGGQIHILDLVLPERGRLGQWLARNDRGHFARNLDSWREIFGTFFEELVFEPYILRRCGVNFWHMVYFKGRRRTEIDEDA